MTQQILDIIGRVISQTDWSTTARCVITRVLLNAKDDASGYRVCDANATQLAEQLGLSSRSVSEALNAADAAGIIEWRKEVMPVAATNRIGEPIPIRHASIERGDYIEWHHTSVIAVRPLESMQTFPALAKSANSARSRVRAAEHRRRAKEMESELSALLQAHSCPSCGTHSLSANITATCASCGTIYTADEIDELLGVPAEPQIDVKSFQDSSSVSENFSRQSEECTEDGGESIEFHADSSDSSDSSDMKTFHVDVLDAECIPEQDDIWGEFIEFHADSSDMKTFHIPSDALKGERTLRYLASAHGMTGFSRAKLKAGIDGQYLDEPQQLEDAAIHLLKDDLHTVGLLPQHSGVYVLDVDAGLSEFLRLNPAAETWVTFIRATNTDRAKFIFRCSEPLESCKRTSADGTRIVELIAGRRHAIIAGAHVDKDGVRSAYACIPGEIPTLSADQVEAIITAFAGLRPHPQQTNPAPKVTSSMTSEGGSYAHRAIQWWMQQSSNVAMVESLVEQLPRKGKYFSLRREDGTPSAMWMRSGDVVHDYGTGEHLDLFELWVRITGGDKRTAINDAYQAMRAAGKAVRR